MAACILEEASITSPIYCQTTNTMERTPAPTNSDHPHRCSFNFNARTNPETTKKRRLSQTEACKSTCERLSSSTISHCLSQAVPGVTKAATTPTRPNSLQLTNSSCTRSPSLLRTFLSHPAPSPSSFPVAEDNSSSPLKFASVPELHTPPAKRIRPQTLPLTPTCLLAAALPSQPLPTASSSAISIQFVSPTELAEKLKVKTPLTVFDCGSPFRHSEHRIRNSILLRVSDRISRKRLKSTGKHLAAIDSKQLHESRFIVLYDDNSNKRRTDTDSTASDDEQLSAAFKCAYEEIQRCLTTNFPPILILSSPFNQFFDLYPHLCESLQPRSCPSSPANHADDSSPPQTAPPTHNSFLLPKTIDQNDIDNHPMTHIIDGLYIGSESNAKNLEQLASEQIQSIVNVTSHVPLYHAEQFKYCHLPADDTQKQSLLEHFDRAYAFIHDALESNQKVLVHCVAGISRSPAIVIGFLMRYAKMNMNEAYDFVKRKRAIVSPNLNFMGQLLEYEKKLQQDK